jgi:hypothetical protein
MNFWVEPFAKRLSISGRNASGPNLSGDVAAYVGTTVDFVGQTGQPWVLLLGKSTEKQRLGYGSEHMIPAADAYRVDASNSQQRPPWGCPEVAGLPRQAGGPGSAGRNRRQTTNSLEQLPPLLVPISRAAAVPRIAVPASGYLGDPSWPGQRPPPAVRDHEAGQTAGGRSVGDLCPTVDH